MFEDRIPIPSKGFYYKDKPEFLTVKFLTTENELMMTSVNLFNNGEAIYKLLEENVCKPNNLSVNELLIGDKEQILLFLKESAYGNIVEYKDGKNDIYFDTYDIGIKSLNKFPEDGKYYRMNHNNNILKLKHLTIADEKLLKNQSKLEYYTNQIHSINGIINKNYIKQYIGRLSIPDGKILKKMIDSIFFGVIKSTKCKVNNKINQIDIKIDESFFGYSLDNLGKINKAINDSIFFLTNEGEGFTWNDVLKMPVFMRKQYEDKLINKITKLNEQMKSNK